MPALISATERRGGALETRPSAPRGGGALRSEKIRFEGLDALRLFAALGVLLYHFAFRGAAADDLTRVTLPALEPVAKYGFLGVDFFFIISGFVVAMSAEGRTWRQFSLARFARLYPAFVFCMTATFVVTLLWGGPRFETSLSQWAVNLLIFSPAVGVPFMDGAYWSIVYEIVFYGWLAVFIAAGGFPKYARPLLVAWLALSVVNELVLGSGALRKLFLTNHSGFFAVGIALYLLHRDGRRVGTWMLFGLSSLVAAGQTLIVAACFRDQFRMEISTPVLALSALGAIALVAAATAFRDVKFRPGLLAAIGGLTYPLYLLHQHAGYILFNRLEGLLPAPAIVAVTATIVITAAWMVCRFVEPPCRRAIYKWADRPSAALARLRWALGIGRES